MCLVQVLTPLRRDETGFEKKEKKYFFRFILICSSSSSVILNSIFWRNNENKNNIFGRRRRRLKSDLTATATAIVAAAVNGIEGDKQFLVSKKQNHYFAPDGRETKNQFQQVSQGLCRLAVNLLQPATVATHCSKNTKFSNYSKQPSPQRQLLRPLTSVNKA